MSMHKRDVSTLEQLIEFFGTGKIKRLDQNSLQLRIESQEGLVAVINHFDKYPLFSKKLEDYLLLKQGFDIYKNKNHLTLEGLRQIVAIKASVRSKGLSDSLKEAFPNIIPTIIPVYDTTLFREDKSILSSWLAGFIGGDGCFFINIVKKPSGKFAVQLLFQVSQHTRDEVLMNSLIPSLGCGHIKFCKSKGRHRPTR